MTLAIGKTTFILIRDSMGSKLNRRDYNSSPGP